MENVRMKVPPDYTYFHVDSTPMKDVFRIKGVTNSAEADEWMKKFSKGNKTIWRTAATFSNVGLKLIYRKDYRCQHLTDKRQRETRTSKNTDCPAKIKIIIHRYQENSSAEFNPIFLKEYPAEVVMKGNHNHPLDSAQITHFGDLSDETKTMLTKLLLEGHSPPSAINSLKLDLMCRNPDNYSKIAADGSNLPSLGLVHRLHQTMSSNFDDTIGSRRIFPDMKEIAKKFKSHSEGIVRYCKAEDGLHSFIVVITKSMMRCHREMKQCSDTVFLDSSIVINNRRLRAHIFTAEGGLPLGIILIDSKEEEVLTEALICYRDLLGDIAFYSVGCPKVFLTNNFMRERNSLKTVFPSASVFLCQFQVLKSMWSWLSYEKHNIDEDHRQNFYFLFKRVVYSNDEIVAEENASDFLEEAYNLRYADLISYFTSLWEIRNDWVNCYRNDLLTQYSTQDCSDTTRLCEKLMNREISADEHLEFECLIGRIKDRISTNPTVFVPAFRKMLENAKQFAASDSGLLAAMNDFATHTATSSQNAQAEECAPSSSVTSQGLGNTNGVESSTKKLIEGRREESIIRQSSKIPPQLHQHDYTHFGLLPAIKSNSDAALARCNESMLEMPADLSGEVESVPADPSGEVESVPADPSGEVESVPADPSGEIESVPADPSGEVESAMNPDDSDKIIVVLNVDSIEDVEGWSFLSSTST